jgi:hypothetical protein
MGSVTHFRFDEANGWREQARLVPPPSSSAQGWDVALDDGVVLSVPQSASDSYLFLLDDALCATPHAVPVAGDVVNLNVNVGKEHAFEPWILLGSTSGTSPGVALPDGSILPLVGDAFFHWTASGGAGAGMLTVDGLAEISYHLVPPSAGLAGGTIHLAVAVGSFPDGVVEVSNPVAVTIAP